MSQVEGRLRRGAVGLALSSSLCLALHIRRLHIALSPSLRVLNYYLRQNNFSLSLLLVPPLACPCHHQLGAFSSRQALVSLPT